MLPIGCKCRVISKKEYDKRVNNRTGEYRSEEGVLFNPEMIKYCGNFLTIVKIDKTLGGYRTLQNEWLWLEEFFDLKAKPLNIL